MKTLSNKKFYSNSYYSADSVTPNGNRYENMILMAWKEYLDANLYILNVTETERNYIYESWEKSFLNKGNY